MTPPLSSARVAEAAASAGFDLCGFARVEPISAAVLVEWLEQGMAADMDWMSERVAERLDVGRILPGAKTVVALACNYHRPEVEVSPIARYARGRDYHYTMRDRLRALRRSLLALAPGLETFSCVDTGPVMEKVWAARAGLGYVGKNGCLITERFGSYVVLATMLLDREVDAYAGDAVTRDSGGSEARVSSPVTDRCGRCTLCITSCPTGAIGLHREVDARTCLSYQTIENRGSVPEGLRPAFQGLVFGCDICQEVCPLNDSLLIAGARFEPRPVARLSIHELAALTPERFRELGQGTPLMRAQYDGLRRNAAYALGAGRDASARAVLERLAADDSERVREAALWALGRLDTAG